MTNLTAFANLPLDELMLEIERMTRNAKRRADDRAQKYAGNTFTPADAPASLRQIIPLDRASAGTHSMETQA